MITLEALLAQPFILYIGIDLMKEAGTSGARVLENCVGAGAQTPTRQPSCGWWLAGSRD